MEQLSLSTCHNRNISPSIGVLRILFTGKLQKRKQRLNICMKDKLTGLISTLVSLWLERLVVEGQGVLLDVQVIHLQREADVVNLSEEVVLLQVGEGAIGVVMAEVVGAILIVLGLDRGVRIGILEEIVVGEDEAQVIAAILVGAGVHHLQEEEVERGVELQDEGEIEARVSAAVAAAVPVEEAPFSCMKCIDIISVCDIVSLSNVDIIRSNLRDFSV
jgi:hypothetical protein